MLTRQGKGGATRPPRCRPGRCRPSAPGGGRPRTSRAADLEQLRHDPRAALALVQLGELQDRRPHRPVAGPAEPVEQAAARAPRAAAKSSGSQSRVPAPGRPAARRPGPLGIRADVAASDRTPALMAATLPARGPASTLCTESSRTDQESPFSSCRVARLRRLKTSPGRPRPGRRSPRACARGSSRSPSACRSGSARGRPRRRCPRPAAARPAGRGSTGSVPGKLATQHRGRRRRPLQPAGLVHQGQQPVEPDRRPHARQPPRGEQAREVVVPPARGDAAELLPAVDRGLEDDARVVVEPAGQAEVDRDPILGNSRRVEQVEDRPQVGDPLGRRIGVRAERVLGLARAPRPRRGPLSAKSSDAGRPGPRSGPRAAVAGRPVCELVEDPVAADLGELVERPQHRAGPAGEAQRVEQAVEDLAVVERDRERRARRPPARAAWITWAVSASASGALGADRVEVALDELAEPPLGRPLAAEDRADRVPLERACPARRRAWRRTGPGGPSGRTGGPARRASRPCW